MKRALLAAAVLLARLLGHELRIDATLAHQRGVPAFLGDMAAVEDEDAVAVDDARQAVREDERRAALHQSVERLLDHRLVLGIDRGQGLVEYGLILALTTILTVLILVVFGGTLADILVAIGGAIDAATPGPPTARWRRTRALAA